MAAQIIKTILFFVMTKNFNYERLTGSGGMPSSHSALVSSLSIGMARAEGISSPIFALTLAFALVVMHDAMGVRRAAGEHAKALNVMSFDLKNFFDSIQNNPLLNFENEDDSEEAVSNDDVDKTQDGPLALKEFLGHTPLEVLAGSLLGILVAMIYPF